MAINEMTLKELKPYYNEYLKKYNTQNKESRKKTNSKYYSNKKKNTNFNEVI